MNRRLILGIPLIAALTACAGSGQQNNLLAPFQSSLSGLLTRDAPKPTAASIRAALTPDVRAELGNRPLKIAVLEQQELASLLIQNATNRDVTTYLTPDGISIALRQGVLVSTRGLGFDLMTADVSGAVSAIRRGGTEVLRVHRYLDGEDQIVIRSFICDYRGRGTVTETCYSDGLQIENTYRLSGGQVIASRQWISPERGYLRLEDAS